MRASITYGREVVTFTQMVLYPPGASIDASSQIAKSDMVKAFIDVCRLGYIDEAQVRGLRCSFVDEIWEQSIAVLRHDGCEFVESFSRSGDSIAYKQEIN
jgi:hypothetical protein